MSWLICPCWPHLEPEKIKIIWRHYLGATIIKKNKMNVVPLLLWAMGITRIMIALRILDNERKMQTTQNLILMWWTKFYKCVEYCSTCKFVHSPVLNGKAKENTGNSHCRFCRVIYAMGWIKKTSKIDRTG